MKPNPRYQPGDKIDGRFLVHQVLMGGMGEVYLCLDLETIQPLALKTFQARYLNNPKIREAFNTEVITWVALEKHPNIVQCFAMDIRDNQPFMFLEWITNDENRGSNLRDWLRYGPLDLRLALDFIIDICRGLVHGNEKQPGIVHCDLKPDNILVARSRLAKITDFGLTRIVQTSELQTPAYTEHDPEGRQSLLGQGGIVGTPPYMAPEQWKGEPLDPRTDIYAVGCIFYEILTGGWPFQANTIDDFRLQHLEANIPKITKSLCLPNFLDMMLLRCLAKQQKDRFATFEELLQELEIIYKKQFDKPPRTLPPLDEFSAFDYNNRGNTYYQLKRYEFALADFNQAIVLDPNFAPNYINRGNVYKKLQQDEVALKDFNLAVDLDPKNALAYYNRGTFFQELGQYKDAQVDFDKAIAFDPTYIESYVNRGISYHYLGQYEEAIVDFNKAIGIDINFQKAYCNRSLAYIELQQYDNALADANRAISLDHRDAKSYVNRGVAYYWMGRLDAALASYTKAIELDRELLQAYQSRGMVYQDSNRYIEAKDDYSNAIALAPKEATLYVNRGFVNIHLQLFEEALADFTLAISFEPELVKAYLNRASVYAILQRYEEAQKDFTQAIELGSNDAQVFVNRGITYIYMNCYKEAFEDVKQAITIDIDNADANFYLGVLLFASGEVKKSLFYAQNALLLGMPEAKNLIQKITKAIGMTPEQKVDLTKKAFKLFNEIDSFDAMKRAITDLFFIPEFAFMTDPHFIQAVEHAIKKKISSEDKPVLKQRLAWLKQIANEQKREEENQ